MTLVAVAIGLVSEARSNTVSGLIGTRQGSNCRLPKARRKTIFPRRPTTTTQPGNRCWRIASSTPLSISASFCGFIATASGSENGSRGGPAGPAGTSRTGLRDGDHREDRRQRCDCCREARQLDHSELTEVPVHGFHQVCSQPRQGLYSLAGSKRIAPPVSRSHRPGTFSFSQRRSSFSSATRVLSRENRGLTGLNEHKKKETPAVARRGGFHGLNPATPTLALLVLPSALKA